MVLFGLCKGLFNCLLAPAIQALPVGRFCKCWNGVQRILPHTSCHQPSLCTCAQAFVSARTICVFLLRSLQAQEPLEGNVLMHRPCQLGLGWNPIQVSGERHSEQQLRFNCRSFDIGRIERFAKVMDEAEIHRCIDLAQKLRLSVRCFFS